MGCRGDQCHGGCSGDGVDQVRINSGWGGGGTGKREGELGRPAMYEDGGQDGKGEWVGHPKDKSDQTISFSSPCSGKKMFLGSFHLTEKLF